MFKNLDDVGQYGNQKHAPLVASTYSRFTPTTHIAHINQTRLPRSTNHESMIDSHFLQ